LGESLGRSNRTRQAPQRSHLPANRELICALRAEAPKPFGVRRPVSYESETALVEAYAELARDEPDLFAKVVPRRRLHVTLFPLRELGAQLSRGIVAGYQFGREQAQIENNIKQGHAKRLEVNLGSVAIIKNRYIAATIENDPLETEHLSVRHMMGRVGVKGALRELPPLHISLGDIGPRLSKYEKGEITERLQTVLPMKEPVVLEPPEFYAPRA
jgi:hypothetical protein